MKSRNIILFCFIMTAIIACKNSSAPISTKDGSKLPAEFTAFYEKFHDDSLFQIQHCVFPMEGLPDQADSLLDRESFRWTADMWRMQHRIPADSKLKTEYSSLFETMITERILDEEKGLGMERRFAKIGDEWELIYYVGMNRYTRVNK